MLKFRFKVSTEAGQVRVGHIEAVSLDVARRLLEGKRFTVLELHEATPAQRSSRRARAPYPPHPIEYLEKLETAPSRRNALLATLGLLGLVLALWYGAGPMAGEAAAQEGREKLQEVHLMITGQVKVPSELRHRATLRFSMVDLPLTLVRDYEGLVGESGEYRLEYEFEGSRAPGSFSAELLLDGHSVGRAERVAFSGQPYLGQVPLLGVGAR